MSVESGVLIKEAALHHRLSSRKGLLERLFSYWFDGFVYNQIWEDPHVDMMALKLNERSRVLTISSGGCNILNYLTQSPQHIHAVDLNTHHLHLTKLKLTAFERLPSFDDFFDFFGRANLDSNLVNYHRYIEPNLDRDAKEYWNSRVKLGGRRIHYFKKNLYNYGKMGFFIRFVHVLARRFVSDPRILLSEPDRQKRIELFEEKFEPFFDRAIVRFLGRLPILFYNLGIPPQQFESMKSDYSGRMNELYRDRVKRLACDFPIEDNYFAWQAFARQYDYEGGQALPDYLKPEFYDTISNNLGRVSLHHCSTVDFLKSQPNNALNRFIFLDSQDWMTDRQIIDQWTEVARVGEPGSRIIFRTAGSQSIVEKALPFDLRSRFVYDEALSRRLHALDRSAIYGGFFLYKLIK